MVGRAWQRLGRDRPLLLKGARELWQLRGQVLAIMLVVAAGVATFLMAISTYASLQATRASFYRSQHFADAFVQLTRAPERLARSLAEIPGVRVLETRVAGGGQLRIEVFDDPVRAWLVSLPERGEGQLNRLYLRQGRLPVEGGRGEVVVGEAFASAHGLRPGDPLPAIIRGRAQTLRVVGVGISPEFVYQIQAGAAFPDFKRFGVLWMRREALAEALELDQAFNHLAIALVDPERDGPAVLAELQRRQLRSILVEGGGELLGHFIRSGLWDEAREIVGEVLMLQGTRAPRMGMLPQRSFTSGSDRIHLHTRSSTPDPAWRW